jgi:hypothetical protein
MRAAGLDLGGAVADEHADADAGLAQGRDVVGQAVLVARHVQPALGGAFLAPFGHQAGGMGAQAQQDGLHLIRRGAFEVQRNADAGGQRLHVGIADVAAIFAQMGGDAVGARRLGQNGGAQGIGPGAATGVAHRRHMVDVDPQPQPAAPHLPTPCRRCPDLRANRARRHPRFRPDRRDVSAGRRPWPRPLSGGGAFPGAHAPWRRGPSDRPRPGIW